MGFFKARIRRRKLNLFFEKHILHDIKREAKDIHHIYDLFSELESAIRKNDKKLAKPKVDECIELLAKNLNMDKKYHQQGGSALQTMMQNEEQEIKIARYGHVFAGSENLADDLTRKHKLEEGEFQQLTYLVKQLEYILVHLTYMRDDFNQGKFETRPWINDALKKAEKALKNLKITDIRLIHSEKRERRLEKRAK